MKRDFIDVISKYVQVDRDKIEVNFEQQDKALAMLANVPILAVNRQNEERKPPSTPSAPATGLPRRKRRRKAAASSTLAGPAPAT